MNKVILPLIAVALSTQACSGVVANNIGEAEYGRVLISADAQGMAAFGDVMNGLVNNTKTPPEIESSHYQLRKEQVRTRGLRFMKKKGGK